MEHTLPKSPLEESTRIERLPEPCVMVIFDASGDLTRRKLIPAIFDLARQGRLPAPFSIVGVARTPMDHNGFRAHLLEAMKEFGRWREGDGLRAGRRNARHGPESHAAASRIDCDGAACPFRRQTGPG